MAAFQREHAYVAQALDPSHIPDHKLAENQLPTKENRDLHDAATAGDVSGLKSALSAGGNPNWYNKSEDGAAALHRASANGHLECMEILIKNGSVVDERLLTNNNSALHLACGNGHLEAVTILIATSAAVNAGNSYGNTPTHAALMGGHRAVVELLLENGANVQWTNNKGSSLLHFLAYSTAMPPADKKVLALKLVQAGVNLESKDEDGMTPLHVVGQSGDKEMATFLFENGADITAKDNKGRTPLQWAQLNSHTEVGSLLKRERNVTGSKNTGDGGGGGGAAAKKTYSGPVGTKGN